MWFYCGISNVETEVQWTPMYPWASFNNYNLWPVLIHLYPPIPSLISLPLQDIIPLVNNSIFISKWEDCFKKYSHTQKQTYGSMELNREPRNRPTFIQLFNFWLKEINEERLFNKWCWKHGYSYGKIELPPIPNHYPISNSKYVTDLDFRAKTTKLPEENTKKNFMTIK